jgi:hypothetical protein
MRVRSGRQVAALWAVALLIFLASAWASTALLPQGPVNRPTASYYVGLVGLVAVGIALVPTWRWVHRVGAVSRSGRVVLTVLLTMGAVLWVAAMVFPFL